MVKVSELFDVRYGVNLELNALHLNPQGINFVSRTARNNGVSARVDLIPGIEALPAGTITVAGGGSVMESFLQPEPYYSGRDLYYLTAKQSLTDAQKLFYCACLRMNKYRFSYGRQANRTLKEISIPDVKEIPSWVSEIDVDALTGKDAPASEGSLPQLDTNSWKAFRFSELFHLKKGKRLTKANMIPGQTPFIGAIDSNNGLTHYIAQGPLHPANTISVNYNGNGVAEAYYQPVPFRCTDDVNVLYPRFELNPAIGLFVATIIRREKYRFSYGRKWHLERMAQSEIRLPVKTDGTPDWDFMENYIKLLPFSSQVG